MTIYSSRSKYRSLEPHLRAALSAALSFLKEKPKEIDVYLIEDKEMQKLNRQFRGKNKPTNVLSFESSEGAFRPDLKGGFLGEVILAPDYIKTKKESLSRLLIHGVLHLLGYSHKSLRDRIKMEALENRIEAHLKGTKKYF